MPPVRPVIAPGTDGDLRRRAADDAPLREVAELRCRAHFSGGIVARPVGLSLRGDAMANARRRAADDAPLAKVERTPAGWLVSRPPGLE